ncbi:Dyp-type peroxidase [Amycolatopsis anabasis]|uniref:Dyp-type peroxidase n=1 Tax=Amycolatopsis anabasis TaxID=1840409 RepID=UPI00131E1149|nr:Dyp-type peroxidase [Amycolatopsis anabasis]
MAIDLSRPLCWKNATGDAATMLNELQPNILKPHVRDHLSVLFLRFDDPAAGRTFLKALVPLMKSARTQLEETEAFKSGKGRATPYVGLGLAARAYRRLGIANAPADQPFADGAKAAIPRLKDPEVGRWERQYQQDIDAVVLVGADLESAMKARRREVLNLAGRGITVLGEEIGLSQVNENGDGIEHFGYVDGRSQPLFLTEDIENERRTTDGINEWDPSTALDRVLVPDTAAPNPRAHFGSYFVFRKLEQNVRLFKQAEQDLATALGLTGEDRERAGAMLVGRFEDGTPLTLQRKPGLESPVGNDFSYFSDGQGAKCPFQSHIRKTNPRGSGGAETPEAERRHLFARRAQTYGKRRDRPNADLPPAVRPTGGVGLLFMAFNAELGNQFEFIQANWANQPQFPVVPPSHKAPGLDLVIGQGERIETTFTPDWAGEGEQAVEPAPQAVTMKGGEYFFMPSLAFLRTL